MLRRRGFGRRALWAPWRAGHPVPAGVTVRLSLCALQIERSFVSEILLRQDARAIVQMIANLATTPGVAAVCEGVETAEQLQAFSSAGCDQVQGYLMSEPRPLAQMLQLQRD